MKPGRNVVLFLAPALLALQGCATIQREPFTAAEQSEATIPDIPDARFWADAPDAARQMSSSFTSATGEKAMLALSGGSDNGAYGAGILNGWSQAGTRPEFSIVTGVSTGALTAPLAFLGPDQDATLARIYTTISAKDIYRGRFALAVPASPSAASTRPLAQMIASVMTDALIDRVAHEFARGRRLFVGTANLDAQRMVVWNMGAIAASKAPGRYALFRQVLLASSAIPAVFTPVMIKAEAEGKIVTEMHVDGSTTAQILALPSEVMTGSATAAAPLHLYLIVNNKLDGAFRLVTPKIIPIAERALDLNLRSSLVASVDLSYAYAKSHGIDFNLSFIRANYPGDDHKPFDTAYMRGLYAYGQQLGRSGAFWDKHPPDRSE